MLNVNQIWSIGWSHQPVLASDFQKEQLKMSNLWVAKISLLVQKKHIVFTVGISLQLLLILGLTGLH